MCSAEDFGKLVSILLFPVVAAFTGTVVIGLLIFKATTKGEVGVGLGQVKMLLAFLPGNSSVFLEQTTFGLRCFLTSKILKKVDNFDSFHWFYGGAEFQTLLFHYSLYFLSQFPFPTYPSEESRIPLYLVKPHLY